MSEKISIGIVGGGRVGEHFLRDLSKQPDMRIVGVVTSTEARQKELAGKYGIKAWGTTEQMLTDEDKPAVACVVNANDRHYADTLACLAAGVHVYCEKPMAPTLQECAEMVAAEAKSSASLQVGFEYIHGKMTSRLKSFVDDGYFGQVLWASVLDSRGHWWAFPPETPLEEIWKLDRKRGGGIIFHCGIHQLDMIRHYLGPIEKVTAYCPPRNPLPYYPADVPANVTLICQAASGATANFQVFHDRAPCGYRDHLQWHKDWRTIPGHEFTVSLVGSEASCKMDIYGEKLHLFRFDHDRKDTVLDHTENFSPNHPDASHHDIIGLVLKYIRSVKQGRGAVDPPSDALETMRIAYAAEDAIGQPGQAVSVADYR